MSPPVFLHVGFAKAGSTFLQTGLFARAQGIRYLGKPYPDEILDELVLSICFEDSSTFSIERCRRAWSERDRWTSGTGPFVLSDEGMTFYMARDTLTCARRCAEVFGDARILFTVRNQIDSLTSYFRNHVLLNTTCHACKGTVRSTIADWLELQWIAMERRHKTYLSSLRYDSVISTWAEVFGRDRIEVGLFEDMRASPGRFFADLCETLDVGAVEPPAEGASQRNRGRSARRLLYEQVRNRLWGDPEQRWVDTRPHTASTVPPTGQAERLGPFFRFLQGGRQVRIRIPDVWRARIVELYRAENERLATDYGVNLRAHDYPL